MDHLRRLLRLLALLSGDVLQRASGNLSIQADVHVIAVILAFGLVAASALVNDSGRLSFAPSFPSLFWHLRLLIAALIVGVCRFSFCFLSL